MIERDVARPVDDAHPAAPRDLLDPVAGEHGSGGKPPSPSAHRAILTAPAAFEKAAAWG